MHFLVLGATGAIGSKFCALALNKGHRLSLLVRNPKNLPQSLMQNPAVEIIEGTLDNETVLDRAASCGASIFVSFAGPRIGTKGTPLTLGYKALVPRLIEQNFKRILILCTPSYHDAADTITLKWQIGAWFMRLFSAGQYREMVGIGEYIASLPVGKRVQWTLFRVGGLTEGEEAPVKATSLGSGDDGTWISRASVATWALDEIDRERWLGKAPYIYPRLIQNMQHKVFELMVTRIYSADWRGSFRLSILPFTTWRAHTKSRHGCERCKRRRIKCDEAGPPCGHCAARKADCRYPTGGLFRHSEWSEQCQNSPISPSYRIDQSATSYESGTNLPFASEASHSALPTVPRGRMRELQLMHVWSMKTCHSFSSNLSDVFQSFVVEQAFHHPFLMDSLLALTSLHIASGTASSNDNNANNSHGPLNSAIVSEYIGGALRYQNSAVPAFSSVLKNILPSNCDALFACSAIMMACAVVAPFIGRSRGNTRENLTSPFHFVKGIHSVIDKSRPWLAKGPFQFAILTHSDNDWESNCFAKDETMAIPWIVVVGEDFVDLVQQEEPMALLVYMYWGVLLSRLKEVWWATLSGRGIVNDLAKELAGIDGWTEAIQWATEEVGTNKEN
ncbi:hypothetical protein BDV30DRAFT_226267 [Aspergillus minisclerotigenes]|uniref:Zn(2)-C6 fungal-type domain-containing protein n=1 Tax=Aspergillus minisclerotigenes TaxID=656917 RepID=A0A5N6J6L0_9EURO|nr:hypothetical protein BDV30DRAFT_226267 [Aspergillus minisclerotigenes]